MAYGDYIEDVRKILERHGVNVKSTFANGPNGTGVKIKQGGQIHPFADMARNGYIITCVRHNPNHTQLWINPIDDLGPCNNFPDTLADKTSDVPDKGFYCLNCRDSMDDRECPNCGQEGVRRS